MEISNTNEPDISRSQGSEQQMADKIQVIWDELKRVGTSWQEQVVYIGNLEAENSRLRRENLQSRAVIDQCLASLSNDQDNAKIINPEIIRQAYRLFLQREPESTQVIKEALVNFKNFDNLLHSFLQCEEFSRKHPSLVKPEFRGTESPIEVETEANDKKLRQLLDVVHATWKHLGLTDPHWSVLTSDAFKREALTENEDLFYATGQWETDRLMGAIRRAGIDPKCIHSCIDYGCGVGRVTTWLATLFPKVMGFDISGPHIALAESYVKKSKKTSISFRQVKSIDEASQWPKVDLFFSIIVLQHNPPPVMEYILRHLLRTLNPNGLGYFQIPTYISGYSFEIEAYLEKKSNLRHTEMEMHVIPQARLFKIFREEKVELLEVIETNSIAIQHSLSNCFLVQKLPAKC